MKPVRFLGDSLKRLREFPDKTRQDAGYQLDKVQNGEQPEDFKPMPSVGMGIEELRQGRYWRLPRNLCGALCRGGVRAARFPEENTSNIEARY